MFKNVATKVALFAFDTTTGAAKTGDAANITAYVSKDYGTVTVLADTSATEMDATNAKGWYLFDVAQAESNADALLFSGKSTTANIAIVAQYVFTTPNLFTTLSIDANGLVSSLAVQAGTAQAGGAATITLASGAVATDSTYNGSVVTIYSGTGVGQSRVIVGYVGSTKVATVARNWATNPDSTSVYKVHGLAAPRVDDSLSVPIQSVAKKNTALAKVMFFMQLTGTESPATGVTPTVSRSLDGGAFASGTLSAVTEVAGGWYYVDMAAADRNGNVVILKAAEATCRTTYITFLMEP